MSPTEWRSLYQAKIPFAPLGIIALEGSKELATLIDRHLTKQRGEFLTKHQKSGLPDGFIRESFLINFNCFRFMGKARRSSMKRSGDMIFIFWRM